MTVTCQCGRPVDGATLCNACTAALAADLHAVPDLAAELDVTLARQARFGERNGGRSADKPLPYDVRASEAAWVLRNTLTTWCRVMIDELGQDMPKTAPPGESERLTGARRYGRANQDVTTAETALWLAARIGALRTHPAAGEAAEEIHEATHQARRAIDRPAGIDRHYLGPHTCGADLYTKPGMTSLTCPGCTSHVNVDTQRDHIRNQLRDHLGTATYVAGIATGLGVPVTAEAVTTWRNRHYIHGIETSHGRLYRVGDVIDVAQADRQWRKERARTLTQACAH